MPETSDTPIHKLIREIGEKMHEAACVLDRKGLQTQSMMLAYATIDIMASLVRPTHADRVTRRHFKDWADTYLLPLEHNCEVTAADLYGARCGLLHTYSPLSSLSRAGEARKVWYATEDTSHELLEASGKIQYQTIRAVHISLFLAELWTAVVGFCTALETDQDLASRAELRRDDLLKYQEVS